MSIKNAINIIASFNKSAGIFDSLKGYSDKEAKLVKQDPEEIGEYLFRSKQIAFEEDGFKQGKKFKENSNASKRVLSALRKLAPGKLQEALEIYNQKWFDYSQTTVPQHEKSTQHKKDRENLNRKIQEESASRVDKSSKESAKISNEQANMQQQYQETKTQAKSLAKDAVREANAIAQLDTHKDWDAIKSRQNKFIKQFGVASMDSLDEISFINAFLASRNMGNDFFQKMYGGR